ncbi:sperm-specific sodium:proton exchanger-like [Ornithodoros turicata]|uniref:sperm-specific sodium:proton exchanger-like n=1 Tax=Ornithodoros turicata TaxID=34597 RepID=UPI003138A58B
MDDLGSQVGVLIILLVVILSALLRVSLRMVNIPVIAVIVVSGFFSGMAVDRYHLKEQMLAITDYHINELLILYMPVLVFTVSFSTRYHMFRKCFWQCCILGCVGLLVSCFLFVVYMDLMGMNSSPVVSVMVSILICSPDPLYLKDLSFCSIAKSHIMETLLLGESLIAASVLWFVHHIMIAPFTLSGLGMRLLTTTLFGPCLGKLVGHLLAYMLISLSQDVSITYLVSISAVYMTYLTSELLLMGSGVTAVIALGVTTAAHCASTIMDPAILRKFWGLFRYTYSVVLIYLASFKVGRDSNSYIDLDDINTIVHSYLAKIIVRGVMIVLLYPIVCSTGYQLTWKQCTVMFWVNFKGAFMMGISLSKWLTDIDVSLALKEEAIRLGVLFLVQVINTTTLPRLVWSLDLGQLSEAETTNMAVVVNALRKTASASTNAQRREKKFSGADWKWIQLHTYIDNPYATIALAASRARLSGLSIRRRRSDVIQEQAQRSANRNILRLQKVCYNKQYEEGMALKGSTTTILALLQYPLEREKYLTVDMVMPYITVPKWIYSLKNLLQRYAGTEAIEHRRSTRVLSTRMEDFDTSYGDVDILTMTISQGWYHVLVGFIATGFVLLLSGLTILYMYRSTDQIFSLVTSVQGVYVVLYAVEIFLVVYTVGVFRSGDIWRKLDFIIFALTVLEFVLASFASASTDKSGYTLFILWSFIMLAGCRTIKTLQKRVVMYVWLWDMMDGLLNRKLFYAYDVSWSYITAEDEAMARVARHVHSVVMAKKIRDTCRRNKLETLKNVIDIQQKYPNIEVATKTRQAARRVLNKAMDGLRQLQEGGLLEDRQYAMLYEDLTWTIHTVDGMPRDIMVGDTLLCILLSVPWLPNEIVPNLLQSFYVSQKKGSIIVFAGHEHETVSIICSGIVKVFAREAVGERNVSAVLENSDSNQYYTTETAFKDYLVAPDAVGIIGFLTHGLSVCQAVCETEVQCCSIPMEVMERIVEHHPDPPTVIYRMWFAVAVRISMAMLVNQKRYQDWTNDKLRRFLESGIMPNLYCAAEFALDDAVQDVILIQGLVTSNDGLQTYYGPAYIPEEVRAINLPGTPSSRSRPIMLITTLTRYHLPAELDWYHQPLRPFDYMPRPRAEDDAYAHW